MGEQRDRHEKLAGANADRALEPAGVLFCECVGRVAAVGPGRQPRPRPQGEDFLIFSWGERLYCTNLFAIRAHFRFSVGFA